MHWVVKVWLQFGRYEQIHTKLMIQNMKHLVKNSRKLLKGSECWVRGCFKEKERKGNLFSLEQF